MSLNRMFVFVRFRAIPVRLFTNTINRRLNALGLYNSVRAYRSVGLYPRGVIFAGAYNKSKKETVSRRAIPLLVEISFSFTAF